MNVILRTLRKLLGLEPGRPPHGELDHRHWDRVTRKWRSHDEQQREDDAAA
jgi:hypothetical protein